ncbi:MAG: sigma-70 family RNA polymerase sigma factor [bacterium]|nr:sigma-70 family RNA polymerase sigma factor [bacterium]
MAPETGPKLRGQLTQGGLVVGEAPGLDRSRFNKPSITITEMHALMESVRSGVLEQHPDASVLEFYRRLAEHSPSRVSTKSQALALKAAVSPDPDLAEKGQDIFLFLRLRTNLAAIAPYLSKGDNDLDDDIVQAAIAGVLDRLEDIRAGGKNIAENTFRFAKGGAAAFLAKREDMPIGWVLKSWPHPVQILVEEALAQSPLGLSEDGFRELADRISRETGLHRKEVGSYISRRSSSRGVEGGAEEELSLDEVADRPEFLERLKVAVETLGDRSREVLDFRYGLSDGQIHTLDEAGERFGLSMERVRQIESQALRKLRHPRIAGRLKPFLG